MANKTIINERDKCKLYDDAVDKWGKPFLVLMAIGEMSELIQILIHHERKNRKIKYNDLASEIADVKIMLEQLEYMFSCSDLVKIKMQEKLLRLRNMIDEE